MIQTVNTYIPIEPAAIFLQGVFTQLVILKDKRQLGTIGESVIITYALVLGLILKPSRG